MVGSRALSGSSRRACVKCRRDHALAAGPLLLAEVKQAAWYAVIARYANRAAGCKNVTMTELSVERTGYAQLPGRKHTERAGLVRNDDVEARIHSAS